MNRIHNPDKHKSFEVAASPPSGSYGPFWRQSDREKEKCMYLEAAPSICSKYIYIAIHSIPYISNQIFWLSDSPSSLSLFWLPYLLPDGFLTLTKPQEELSLHDIMPETSRAKYSSLILTNSTEDISLPCRCSQLLIFSPSIKVISNSVKLSESQSIAETKSSRSLPARLQLQSSLHSTVFHIALTSCRFLTAPSQNSAHTCNLKHLHSFNNFCNTDALCFTRHPGRVCC